MPSVRYYHIGLVFFAVLLISLTWIVPGLAQEGTDEEKLQLGAKVYAENCVVCHGTNGEGRVGATLAKDWPSIRPDLRVKETIENGVPGSPMPAWSQANNGPLSDTEIDALVYYILSWQTGGPPLIAPTPTSQLRPPVTPPPGVTGDPNQGAILYDKNCLVCHGPNGEGRVGVTLAKDWPSIRPDLRVQASISNGVPGSAMPAWSQEKGGPLTVDEIDNLTAFILTWSTPANPATLTPTVTQPQAGRSINWSLWLGILFVVLVLVATLLYANRSQNK